MSLRAVPRTLSGFLPRLQRVGLHSQSNISISDFASTKRGTGGGSFIELPEFKPLHDSILVKIPSSCTVYGKLNKINAISSDSNSREKPFLAQETDPSSGFSKLVTGEHPVNVIIASPTPISNVSVVKVDRNEEDGLFVPNFTESVLCYSGNLTLSEAGKLHGYGVVGIEGKGPVYQVNLKEGEEMMVKSESILAYDSKVTLKLTKLKSPYGVPDGVSKFFARYLAGYYDRILVMWNKWFTSSKVFSKFRGPGMFFLQTNFIPGSREYTKEEILETLEPKN